MKMLGIEATQQVKIVARVVMIDPSTSPGHPCCNRALDTLA